MNYEQEIENYTTQIASYTHKGDHNEVQRLKLARKKVQMRKCKDEILNIKVQLALHPTGQVSELKKLLKQHTSHYKDLVIHKGSLYNGGVW